MNKDKLAYSINGALEMVPFGRSFLYEQIKLGKLKVFKVGKRTLIAAEDLTAWLNTYKNVA